MQRMWKTFVRSFPIHVCWTNCSVLCAELSTWSCRLWELISLQMVEHLENELMITMQKLKCCERYFHSFSTNDPATYVDIYYTIIGEAETTDVHFHFLLVCNDELSMKLERMNFLSVKTFISSIILCALHWCNFCLSSFQSDVSHSQLLFAFQI